MFNATFNNILAISWRSVILVKETRENHTPVASDWQTLSHKRGNLKLFSPSFLKIHRKISIMYKSVLVGFMLLNLYHFVDHSLSFFFWPLYCLFFFDLRLLIISLVSFDHCIVCSSLIYGFWLSHWYLFTIVLSVLLWFTASDYLIDIFWPLLEMPVKNQLQGMLAVF